MRGKSDGNGSFSWSPPPEDDYINRTPPGWTTQHNSFGTKLEGGSSTAWNFEGIMKTVVSSSETNWGGFLTMVYSRDGVRFRTNVASNEFRL